MYDIIITMDSTIYQKGFPTMKVYILSHKAFNAPSSPDYVPLQVGAALHEDLGYLRDDVGDNISSRNPFYSELTGLYWVWKHDHTSEIIGFSHYRRYLLDSKGQLYQDPEVRRLLQTNDLITTKVVTLDYNYYEAFGGRHHQKDLDILCQIMQSLHPNLYPLFWKLLHENHTYFGNLFFMKREVFHAYMDFLFPILFAMEPMVDMTGYDGYQKRLFGFLSEFLLYVWVQANKLTVHESMVGLLGEKTEIAECKDAVAKHLAMNDLPGAKEAFLTFYRKRPDILMEVSDINRECRLTMQAISSIEQELSLYGTSRLDRMNQLPELIDFYRKLNQITGRYHTVANDLTELYALSLPKEELDFLQNNHVTPEEVRISFLLQHTAP